VFPVVGEVGEMARGGGIDRYQGSIVEEAHEARVSAVKGGEVAVEVASYEPHVVGAIMGGHKGRQVKVEGRAHRGVPRWHIRTQHMARCRSGHGQGDMHQVTHQVGGRRVL
jgi:hypothetical protein